MSRSSRRPSSQDSSRRRSSSIAAGEPVHTLDYHHFALAGPSPSTDTTSLVHTFDPAGEYAVPGYPPLDAHAATYPAVAAAAAASTAAGATVYPVTDPSSKSAAPGSADPSHDDSSVYGGAVKFHPPTNMMMTTHRDYGYLPQAISNPLTYHPGGSYIPPFQNYQTFEAPATRTQVPGSLRPPISAAEYTPVAEAPDGADAPRKRRRTSYQMTRRVNKVQTRRANQSLAEAAERASSSGTASGTMRSGHVDVYPAVTSPTSYVQETRPSLNSTPFRSDYVDSGHAPPSFYPSTSYPMAPPQPSPVVYAQQGQTGSDPWVDAAAAAAAAANRQPPHLLGGSGPGYGRSPPAPPPSLLHAPLAPPSGNMAPPHMEQLNMSASGGGRDKPQCWDHGCNGREFSTFSNLLRHQREKSGSAAKSYCPHCGAEFTRTTARNGHVEHGKCKTRKPSGDGGVHRP